MLNRYAYGSGAQLRRVLREGCQEGAGEGRRLCEGGVRAAPAHDHQRFPPLREGGRVQAPLQRPQGIDKQTNKLPHRKK
eukprot:6300789-Pyramimonas_sp.AAC.1